jgi:hypothetical protein
MSHIKIDTQIGRGGTETLADARKLGQVPTTKWSDLKDNTVLAYCAYGLPHLGTIQGLPACPSDEAPMVPTGDLTRAYLVAPNRTFALLPISRAPADSWPCMTAAGPAGG